VAAEHGRRPRGQRLGNQAGDGGPAGVAALDRASELASLALASFDLSTSEPTVTVNAAYSKNRAESVQPLPPDVAEVLHGYV
jgi:hypothetical protein